jgi:hypothetical protein
MSPQTIQYGVTAVVIGLVLILRLRNTRRARPLRLQTLWIVPAIYALVFAFACYERPPVTLLGWVWLAVAAAVGAAIGWWRGKLMRISVDPETGTLNQQASPAALLFIVLLIAIRQGLRYEGAAYGINVLQLTGILMASALGLFTASRAEMFIRARRLLDGHRA